MRTNQELSEIEIIMKDLKNKGHTMRPDEKELFFKWLCGTETTGHLINTLRHRKEFDE